ncbi:hypothetical protein WHR41_09596 [Cladosporium halotolerans]|uniref:Uncharacterized protein n=1 Tax=Cladosporium halotolerans TaxID=1052096 RepID=A0AB34KD60_9PEZI
MGPNRVPSTATESHVFPECFDQPCMFLFDEEYQLWNNRKPAPIFSMRLMSKTQIRRRSRSIEAGNFREGEKGNSYTATSR